MLIIHCKKNKNTRLSATSIIIMAILLAAFLYCFVLDIVIVRGKSMQPTLKDGSIIFINRLSYGFRFGDKYLLRWAEPEPKDVVEAILSSGRERKAVKRVFETGPAYIVSQAGNIVGRGGKKVIQDNNKILFSGTNYISQGRVFIVGDNDADSLDSRYYGTVPIENIIGKVILLNN